MNLEIIFILKIKIGKTKLSVLLKNNVKWALEDGKFNLKTEISQKWTCTNNIQYWSRPKKKIKICKNL